MTATALACPGLLRVASRTLEDDALSSQPPGHLSPARRPMENMRHKDTHHSMVRRGTFLSSPLYRATPPSEASDPTSRTRPRNSGVNPSSLVCG